MSSRFKVAGVPSACPPAEFDDDNPGIPAAMNCGGLILFAFILSGMVHGVGRQYNYVRKGRGVGSR